MMKNTRFTKKAPDHK